MLQLVYAVAPTHIGRGIARERVLERLGMTLIATEPGQRWAQLHFALRAPA